MIKEEHIIKVEEWHEVFKILSPTKVSELQNFIEIREKLYYEELEEYFDAGIDLIERADAILDQYYILTGTVQLYLGMPEKLRRVLSGYMENKFRIQVSLVAHFLNLDENKMVKDKFDELFEEVLRSNYTKIEDGKVLYSEEGKILKGENFTYPDLRRILFY